MDPSVLDTSQAALEVLLHNLSGPYDGLPRTAGWGYPEPYTRDLLISALGVLTTGNERLIDSLRRVLETLARNQSPRGQIPSLVHDSEDRGASDTTPLFLLVLAIFRRFTGDPALLEESAERALCWMDYQTVDDRQLVGQQPTSDWRDEHWVLGHGLYVNAVVHGYLRLLGFGARAQSLAEAVNCEDGRGFVCPGQPTYALWFYKVLRDSRCDVLGNSLAILTCMADPQRARDMVHWIEDQCSGLRATGQLAQELPPCFFPYVQPTDPDWHPRYAIYNPPGHYHNGGIWPFVCGLYIAAIVATGEHALAAEKLRVLTSLVRSARQEPVNYGFNEWYCAQTGRPAGQDWQTWSASIYLYAVACVEAGRALFFQEALP